MFDTVSVYLFGGEWGWCLHGFVVAFATVEFNRLISAVVFTVAFVVAVDVYLLAWRWAARYLVR